jgi:hypothetical protein
MDGGFFYLLCRYSDQGQPWSSQLGLLPGLTGLSLWWEIVGIKPPFSILTRFRQPRVGMHHLEAAGDAMIMLLLLWMDFIFGRKLILDYSIRGTGFVRPSPDRARLNRRCQTAPSVYPGLIVQERRKTGELRSIDVLSPPQTACLSTGDTIAQEHAISMPVRARG